MEVDRLAEIKQQMRALRAEERAIRARIVAGLVPLIGDRYVATLGPKIMLHRTEVVTKSGLKAAPADSQTWKEWATSNQYQPAGAYASERGNGGAQ